MRRMMELHEIVEPLKFLMSPNNSYMTGSAPHCRWRLFDNLDMASFLIVASMVRMLPSQRKF